MYKQNKQSRKQQDEYEHEWIQQVQKSEKMQQHFNMDHYGVQSLSQAIEKNIIPKNKVEEAKNIKRESNLSSPPLKPQLESFQLEDVVNNKQFGSLNIQGGDGDDIKQHDYTNLSQENNRDLKTQSQNLECIEDIIEEKEQQPKKQSGFMGFLQKLNPFSSSSIKKDYVQGKPQQQKQQIQSQSSNMNKKIYNGNSSSQQPRQFKGRMAEKKVLAPHELVDKHNNLAGTEFDLGKDGEFLGYTIVIGQFYQFDIEQTSYALTQKGFDVIVCNDEMNFLHYFKEKGSVGIIISGGGQYKNSNEKDFVHQVLIEHHKGKGLWIFADNAPLFIHANHILNYLFEIKIAGDDPGGQTLQLGDREQKGKFGVHMITTGIERLFEGITISAPVNLGALQVIATSSHGKPAVCYADHNVTKDSGRILVDCGFTKLYCHFDTSGTARYIVNAVVWLLDLDRKILSDEAAQMHKDNGLQREQVTQQEKKEQTQ